jgi:long-subunit fatty acid transport protein
MKINKLFITLAIAIGSVASLMAQNTTMSPYSRYGYGTLGDNATSAQRAMGSTGYAMNSGRQINVMNPASYAAIDSTTFLFDMGVDFTSLWSTEGSTHEQNFGGGLDYITLQVPIGKRMGASVGMVPFGSVGYSFGNTITNGTASRSGSGSLNQLYLGLAGRIFKGFSVGANVSYLFGTITNDLYATTSTGYTSLFERSMTVKDWRLEFGVQYQTRIDAQNTLGLGLVYAPKKNLHGDAYGLYYDSTSSSSTADIDTVNANDTKMKGRYSLPETWGAGINWQWNNKLMAELDFTYQPWSKAKYGHIESFEDTKFADRYRIGLGLQYQPAQRGSYSQRMYYRFGTYFNRDYITVLGNNVRDYGVTLGVGLPVPSMKTVVNIGLEFRHRQANPDPLIKENYLNLTLGLNFNEMWFVKNKLY